MSYRSLCTVAGCPYVRCGSHGLCQTHRNRKRNGTPLDAPKYWRADTFDQRVQRRPNGCWQWVGAITDKGYGTYRGRLAHRVSYERNVGAIPKGLQIDHLCRNRACVNPEHMEAVEARVNFRRSHAVGAIATRNQPVHEGPRVHAREHLRAPRRQGASLPRLRRHPSRPSQEEGDGMSDEATCEWCRDAFALGESPCVHLMLCATCSADCRQCRTEPIEDDDARRELRLDEEATRIGDPT